VTVLYREILIQRRHRHVQLRRALGIGLLGAACLAAPAAAAPTPATVVNAGARSGDERRTGDGNLGRAVVISLALLFAGVSVGRLTRSRGAPPGEAPSSPPTAPVLDRRTPRSAAVIRIFLQHAHAQVAALGQALGAADAALIRATAHKLKGSCLAIGAPRMVELCGLLENGGRGAAAHYAELSRSLAQAERELSAELIEAAERAN